MPEAYPIGHGLFVLIDDDSGGWPGRYENEATARAAAQHPFEELCVIWLRRLARDGADAVIRAADLPKPRTYRELVARNIELTSGRAPLRELLKAQRKWNRSNDADS